MQQRSRNATNSESSESNSGSGSNSSDSGPDAVELRGKILNTRYIPLKYIGSGAFATIWLAYDIKNKKYWAIKVYSTDRRSVKEGDNELKYLQIAKDSKCQYLMSIEEEFEHETKFGIHTCIVYPLMAGSLYKVIRKTNGLPLNIIKKIAFQALTGLDIMHRKLSAIHMDIKPENILLGGRIHEVDDLLKKFESISFEQLFGKCFHLAKSKDKSKNIKKVRGQALKATVKLLIETLYPNECQEIFRRNVSDDEESSDEDSDKKETPEERTSDKNNKEKRDEVRRVEDTIDLKYIENIQIKIADLGSCCLPKDRQEKDVRTVYYRSPEDILDYRNSNETCDIWSLACTIYELATGKLLFDPEKDKVNSREAHHLYQMVTLLGPIPRTMLDKCKLKIEFFTVDGKMKGFNRYVYIPISKRLISYGWNERDALEFEAFLLPMLEYLPEKRAKARTCLQHQWLTTSDNGKVKVTII
jgi:serine/threonine-protein kinase SRPK3